MSPALIVIDVQTGLDDPYYGRRNNPAAEENMARLLSAWRSSRAPIVHVKHNSVLPRSKLRPELPGNQIKPIVAPLPDEPLLTKTVNSAFIGTNLEALLRSRGISSIVLVGLTTNHCVSTTARMAANLGFETTVVSDATATHEKQTSQRLISAEEMHEVGLAELDGEFAAIKTTEEVLREHAAH